jgi:peptidoglycan/xylan/chitin deacetylase (PgdA/CDA1 family)
MDMEFLDNLSLSPDGKIILATIPAVLWPRRRLHQTIVSGGSAALSAPPGMHSRGIDTCDQPAILDRAGDDLRRLRNIPGAAARMPLLKFAGELSFRAVGIAGVVMNKVLGSRSNGRVGILTYHRTAFHVPGLPKPLHNVTPDRFEKQITSLLERGFVIWPLSRIIEHGAAGQVVPPRTIALTFDDGYETVYTEVFPILKKLGQPATIFICTAFLDDDGPFPFDEWGLTYRNRAPSPTYRSLTTANCLEMADSGLIELGSHTHTHDDFRNRPEDFRREVETSLEILHSRLGQRKNVAFAFPWGKIHNGFAGERLLSAARQTDITCALTTESRLVDPGTDPIGWGRFNVFPWDTGATLAAKLDGWYSWAPKLRRLFRRAVKRGTSA